MPSFIYTSVAMYLQGKTITKKGTEDNPAVEVTTNKGVPVLKKASELHKDEGSNK